jgi:hypothetical protein
MEKKTDVKAGKAKTHRITGELTSLDAKAGTFAVKEKDKELKLSARTRLGFGTDLPTNLNESCGDT